MLANANNDRARALLTAAKQSTAVLVKFHTLSWPRSSKRSQALWSSDEQRVGKCQPRVRLTRKPQPQPSLQQLSTGQLPANWVSAKTDMAMGCTDSGDPPHP